MRVSVLGAITLVSLVALACSSDRLSGPEAQDAYRRARLHPVPGSLVSSGGKSLSALSLKPVAEKLEFLARLFDAGQLRTVIDRRFPLEEVVPALR